MVSLTTFARSAGARLSERVTAAVWGQTRRLFRMQSRLRSNEPTQIFVCAVTGSVVGALVAGLHALVDLLHQLGFAVAGDHSLSTGIGVDPAAHHDRSGRRLASCSGWGRSSCGASAPTRSSTRSRPTRCMAGACRCGTACAWWSPPWCPTPRASPSAWRPATSSWAPACSPRSGSTSGCAAPTSASSSPPAPPPPSPRPSTRRWPAPSTATS